MSTPLFLESASHALAVHSAVGASRLAATVEENASVLEVSRITGIGIILDSDSALPAQARYKSIKDELMAKRFNLPESPGEIAVGPPRLGAFVLPNNVDVGTLEDLLIECAQQVYPGLLASATKPCGRLPS